MRFTIDGRQLAQFPVVRESCFAKLTAIAGNLNTATHVDFLVFNKISKKPIFAVEVDGFHYHKEGTKQKERDKMKDRILDLYGIPLLRFSTTGSGEKEMLEQMIGEYGVSRGRS